MVQEMRPDGNSPEGERRKTTIIREGPPRPEVVAAMQEEHGSEGRERVEKAAAGGTLLEGLGGTGAAVLTILALLGTYPMTLTAIAAIILGGVILLSAGGIAAIAGRFRSKMRWGQVVSGGAGLEALAAACVVAGGILVLANVVPMTLLPLSVIVLGACCLMASGGLQFFFAGPGNGWSAAKGATAAAAEGVDIEVGLAAIALGVLALAGLQTLLLTEVAVLALGLGVLGKCMALSSYMGARVAGS